MDNVDPGLRLPNKEAAEMSRRNFLLRSAAGGVAAALVLNGCSTQGSNEHAQHDSAAEHTSSIELLTQIGESLIDMHEESNGGWRFKSAIQSPHYQTDRDVGASSVGMGFLVMADCVPKDPKWLNAAEKTAQWLVYTSQTDAKGGKYWADYVDDHEVSSDAYTSFDDGAIGVGDFFWQLYERTQNPQYRKVALATLQWTFDQGEALGNQAQPMYRWRLNANEATSENAMGMGEGAVGLVHTFTTYYERLQQSDPAIALECKQYIDGSLRYIDHTRHVLGEKGGDSRALPETGIAGKDGNTNMNSGYLSGAAGTALMYLKLYKTFGDKQYLTEADKVFSWLQDTKTGPMVNFNDGSVSWKLAIDPQSGNNPAIATGFEEGSAGIGWTYLQAYKITGDKRYLTVAQQAADWLTSVGIPTKHGGMAWNEVEASTKHVMHANLNNGAAGIGMFFKDLHDTTKQPKYKKSAEDALKWITTSAIRDQNNHIYWNDNDGDANYSNDPSWHWGTAGIIAFKARMSGGSVNIPGEQPALQ